MEITKERVISYKTRFLPGDIVYDITGKPHKIYSIEKIIRLKGDKADVNISANLYFSDICGAEPHSENDYYKSPQEVLLAVARNLVNNQ